MALRRQDCTPDFDFETEWRIQESIKTMIRNGWIQSAHDVSDGGLFVTLAESAMAGGKSFMIETDSRRRTDAFLFGESQSRVVVSVSPDQLQHVEGYLDDSSIPFMRLGTVTTTGIFEIDNAPVLTVAEAKALYDNALGRIMA